MKIFIVLSNFPYELGEAIEVVSFEVVRLLADAGHDLKVQVIIRDPENKESQQRQQQAQKSLAHTRIEILDPIFLKESDNMEISTEKIFWKKIRAVIDIFWSLPIINLFHPLKNRNVFWSLPIIRQQINRDLFPATKVSPQIQASIEKLQPDIILSIWSWEALAATYLIGSVPKFVYYGNPDHLPMKARLNHPDLFDIPTKGLINRRLNLRILKMINTAREIQHLKMMGRCQVTANNSLVDADYYTNSGHPRSIYLQNMWPQATYPPAYENDTLPLRPIKIVGSVGNLGATGNTFGLYFIGKSLAPALEKKLGSPYFSINIFGGGRPTEVVASALNHPSIKLRGWVGDLEQEIRSSHVFLVLSNVYGFIVGNTRILLAWSLGACLIAHTNSALSMPEIVHMENALLGDSAEEIAELIIQAARDSALRTKIGRGGFETYNKYYRSDMVVPKMLKEMENCISDWQANRKGGGS